MTKHLYFLAALALSLVSINSQSWAQEGWIEKKVEKPDPCAHENSKYPWGLGPCNIEHLKQKEQANMTATEKKKQQQILEERNKKNKENLINF